MPSTNTDNTYANCNQSDNHLCFYNNHSFPTLGTPGGDNETFANIREAGHKICDNPSQIQCRAEKFPNVTIDDVGQVVQCDLAKGLTCRNEDQSGPLALCFNYQVRVLCCDFNACPTTPAPSTTITTTTPSTTTTKPTPSTTPTDSTTKPPIITTTLPCEETICSWSQWISSDYPQYGPGGGDNETIKHTIQKGYKICENPEEVECQAVHYPGVPLNQLGQTVTCNKQGLLCENNLQNPPISPVEVQCRAVLYPGLSMSQVGQSVICNKDVGLICNNSRQGLQQECFDYEIKFECCGCPTTSPTPTTTSTTTTPSTTTPTTQPTTTTTPFTTTETTTTTQPPTTTTPSTTTETTTTTQPPTTTTPSTTTETTPTTQPNETTTTNQPPTTTTPSTTTETTTSIPSTTTTKPTPSTTPTGSTTKPPVITTTMPCEETLCFWSQWISSDYPQYGPGGGDNETIKHTIQKGYKICENPEEVKCQAVHYPGVPLNQLGQTVTCNKQGLLCENNLQNPPICLDYEIKVKCCKTVQCSTTPKPTTHTVTTRTTTPSTTTETTTTTQPPTNTTPSTTTETTQPITTTTPSTTTETTPTTQPTTTTTPSTTTETTTTTQPPTTTTPSTTTETTTTTQPPTTTTPSTTTETTTTTQPPTTPSTTTETATTTQPPTTSPCPGGHPMTCGWTEWINLGKPTPGPDGGEDESIHKIISAGYHVCSAPVEVQCRAVLYPGLSMSQVGQSVICNKDVGLICNNSRQGLQQECFDYEIKFECCGCPTTSATPTTTSTTTTPSTTTPTTQPTTTTTPSTTTETTTTTQPPTTTTPSTTTETTTTTQPPTTPSTTTETTTTTQPPTTTTPSTTTETTTTTQPPTTPSTTTETATTTQPLTTSPCPGGHPMTCGWTEWINLGKPTPGPDGGEDESIHEIISAGYHVCSAPVEVQCRAVLYPGLSMSQVGQSVICNKDVGLICNNSRQGLQQECFDYEIKFECCGCPTTSATPTTTSTTTTPSTTTPTTQPTTTTTPSTTTETTTTTQPPTTTTPSTTTETTTTTQPPTTPSTTTETTTTTQPPTTTTPSTTTETTTTTQPPTTPSTTTETATTTQPPTTSPCPGGHPMTCGWTEWINLGKPTPGPDGGEDESIHEIISAGYHVCSAPVEVQCRAVLYPGLSMSQVGQSVICNKDVGLICNNSRQGLQQECFDYEIKFECCGCPTTSPTPTTTSTTTTPSTTTPTTQPTTTTTPSTTTETATTTQPPTTTTPSTTTETTPTTQPTTTTTPSTTTETTTTTQPPTTTTPSTTTETTTTTQPPTTPSTTTETTTTTHHLQLHLVLVDIP
ncbi:mucin-5AC-like [Pagrus major]|uniref:mucin-5AC-like n=1 Tax=Pagrus major TaxID=143350 RepID=UPI003CC86F4D